MTDVVEGRRRQRWWAAGGAIAGLLLLAWALRNFDPWRFLDIVTGATVWPLLILPLAIIAEQILRAIKWRQLIYSLRAVGIGRLFGALMAGYLDRKSTRLNSSHVVISYAGFFLKKKNK